MQPYEYVYIICDQIWFDQHSHHSNPDCCIVYAQHLIFMFTYHYHCFDFLICLCFSMHLYCLSICKASIIVFSMYALACLPPEKKRCSIRKMMLPVTTRVIQSIWSLVSIKFCSILMNDQTHICSICKRKTMRHSYTIYRVCCQKEVHRNCTVFSPDEFTLNRKIHIGTVDYVMKIYFHSITLKMI